MALFFRSAAFGLELRIIFDLLFPLIGLLCA
jgi:hypothetical protein